MPSEQRSYAHSLKDRPQELWHDLREHLEGTAARAERFASSFAPGWGRLAGLWHDAGKYQEAFQRHIGRDPDAHCNESVDHATVGALIANRQGAAALAFVIAGHHGGLADYERLRTRISNKPDLLWEARHGGLPSSLESEPLPAAPAWVGTDREGRALWVRFLFSSLTDADFLDTERFYQGVERDFGEPPSMAELRDRLDTFVDGLAARGEQTSVNLMRARVLADCRAAAELPRGAFTLTVPTGGGKTLAALSFALRHAARHDLRRVIVVIPYTSIIEQTAKVYREALGSDAVIEHHSSFDADRETRRNRVASENWDAPIVVTTSVQFFESLYANRPSRCRKLHRIAESVVIFDEVQTFPPSLLKPIECALGQLVSHYDVSEVFCTATQPALRLPSPREIVRDVDAEFSAVANRCEIVLPASRKPVSWEELAQELGKRESVLAVVHRRADAETLARLMGAGCLHLSARMCAAHRSVVLGEVKDRLRAGQPCRLVATQLVEAGVDVDFPEVYRAMAGADALAQAAGRCNREGRCAGGLLHVFIAPTQPPRDLRIAKQTVEVLWDEGLLDLKNPALFPEYFRRLYLMLPDDPGVLAAERELRFEESARLFRMIDDEGTLAVVAPYGDAAERIASVRRDGITRVGLRRLQPFLVNLYRQEVEGLLRAGALEQLDDGLYCTVVGFEGIYDQRFGFAWKGTPAAEPESLIA
jgi:CRISPR-associated endonuclease/helicase Cas3